MTNTNNLKILIGMPAYNEGKYIGSIILQLKQFTNNIIVVDDGSTDSTSLVAKLAGATIIKHENNMGYGTSIIDIFSEAKSRNSDILITLDADSQHNPEEIPSLIDVISHGYDVVIGSRKSQRHNIPLYRRVGQDILGWLTNILSHTKISDSESGFRAYSRKAIRELDLKETGPAICGEIIKVASANNLHIKEVPISAIYTKNGSSINPIRHGIGVLNRLLIMMSEERPLLFFGILGGLSIVLGIIFGILVTHAMYIDKVLQVGFALLSILFITIGTLIISTGIILSVLTRSIKNLLFKKAIDKFK